jgi:hypothetical protein
MCDIDSLPDQARLRVYPLETALDAAGVATLRGGIDKLFRHFRGEGAVGEAAVAIEGGGRLLLLAWVDGTVECLSGCRKDKLARLLRKLESDLAQNLLDTPPLVLEVEGLITCCSRAQLRELVVAGRVDGRSMMWDSRLESLGEWRRSARKPIADSWLAQIVERMVGARLTARG